MSARDPGFDAYVLKIHEVLDRLDYYRLLGVDPAARIPQIKKAFFGIAAKFHPDRNRDADERVQQAIYEIFKRLNEAYRVLCDYEKRKAYDQSRAAGKVRLETTDRRATVPKTPENEIRSREGRQFFRKATEALQRGDLMQAELHGKVAKAREGECAVIDTLLEQIKNAKAAKKQQRP